MEKIINVIKGMSIGIANIIPGVSGGTMAVVLGIYDKLISSINNFFKDWKKNIGFLVEIGVGAVLGILLFSKIITYLLNNHPQQTNFFFIGLIAGSCPMLFKKATEKKIRPINYIWFVVAFAAMLIISFAKEPGANVETIRQLTTQNFISLIIAGFVAAVAMVLPGLSGSFILLLMGLYTSIVTAVSEMNIPMLIPVAIGVALGIITMTKIIEALFKKYPQTAYCAILGLVAASVFVIYPGFTIGLVGLVSILTLVVGFLIAYMIGRSES